MVYRLRLSLFLALAFAAVPAFAAPLTWAPITGYPNSVTGTCASAGTCDAPSAAGDGMSLKGVTAITIVICADSGQVIASGASVAVYYFNPEVNLWARSALVPTVPTGDRCVTLEGDSPAHGIPVVMQRGRIAVKPTSVAAAGGVTITLLGNDGSTRK